MKLSKRIKWLTAVSVLAVGIPAAGMAFANPAQHVSTTNPAAVTQQADQNSAPAAGTAQQSQGMVNISIPADTQQQAPSPAPAVTVSPSPVHNPAHNTNAHMNVSQKSAPALVPAPAPAPQAKPAPANSATGHGYHYGHTGPNDSMSQGYSNNTYGGEHSEHGTGGHE